MSLNPFRADDAVPVRLAKLDEVGRAALRNDAVTRLARGQRALVDNSGGVLPASHVQALIADYDLASVRDLMVLLLDVARQYAAPPISGFHVGAVGMEAETGALILGGNVEFPGAHLGFTLHGEGFVATRAMSRGTSLVLLAIREAHPCAYCRQYLSEFPARDRLEVIDPLGHTLRLTDLYPWPFDPPYLGESGAVALRETWPDLAFLPDSDHPHAELLLTAGRKAHAPYSRCPGALVLALSDGGTIVASSIESVAFNPTIQPVQAAVIDLLAHGYTYKDIEGATLGTVVGGAVDYAASTAELLGRVAPEVTLDILGWQP